MLSHSEYFWTSELIEKIDYSEASKIDFTITTCLAKIYSWKHRLWNFLSYQVKYQRNFAFPRHLQILPPTRLLLWERRSLRVAISKIRILRFGPLSNLGLCVFLSIYLKCFCDLVGVSRWKKPSQIQQEILSQDCFVLRKVACSTFETCFGSFLAPLLLLTFYSGVHSFLYLVPAQFAICISKPPLWIRRVQDPIRLDSST